MTVELMSHKGDTHRLKTLGSRLCFLIVLAHIAIVGCASQDEDTQSDEAKANARYGASESSSAGPTGEQSGDFNGAPLPPELEETRLQLLTPQTARDFMFVAHESLNTVSKIDVDSLAVESISVCDRPTQLKATKEMNLAVVLCQGSDEIELIQLIPQESGIFQVHTRRVGIPRRMNRLNLSPDGSVALTYHEEDENDPLGSVQMVAAVRLDVPLDAPLTVMQLSVGFKVKEITYRTLEGALRGFVISESGASPFDVEGLEESAILPLVPTAIPSESGEILVSESGRYMISRGWETSGVHVTRISDGLVKVIQLSAPPTDIDNVSTPSSDSTVGDEVESDPNAPSSEGITDRLLVMVRDTQDALLFSLDELIEGDEVNLEEWRLETQAGVRGLATVSGAGRWALLYTTLNQNDELYIVDLTGRNDSKTLSLRKGINGVHISRDHHYALITHPPQSLTEGMSAADQLIALSPAYSIVHLDTAYSRLIPAQAEVKSSAFWSEPESSDAFAFLIFEGEARVDRVDLGDLSVETRRLGSLALDVGRVTARGKMWVNQEHPLGRLSFWDIVSGELLTLTGFELNRRVQ